MMLGQGAAVRNSSTLLWWTDAGLVLLGQRSFLGSGFGASVAGVMQRYSASCFTPLRLGRLDSRVPCSLSARSLKSGLA